MRLSHIHNKSDVLGVLLGEVMDAQSIARIRLEMRNVTAATPHNGIIGEAFLSGMGKVALFKSRAMAMLPSDVTNDPDIKRLIKIGRDSPDPLSSPKMGTWWSQLGKVIKKDIPSFNPDQALRSIRAGIIKKETELHNQLGKVSAGHATDAARDSELDDVGGTLKHEKALRDLHTQYGAETPVNKKAFTIASLLNLDPETSANLDPETAMDVLKQLTQAKKTVEKKAGNTSTGQKTRKQLEKRIAMLMDSHKGLLKQIEDLEKEREAARAVKPLSQVPAQAATTIKQALERGVGIHETYGFRDLAGDAVGMFTKQGRSDLVSKHLEAAMKHYLIVLAIKEMLTAAKQSIRQVRMHNSTGAPHEHPTATLAPKPPQRTSPPGGKPHGGTLMGKENPNAGLKP